MTECHVIFIENLAENFNENSDKSFIIFCFDLVIESCCDSADQNSHNIVESYFSLF